MYLPGLPSLTRQLGASTSTGQLTLTGCLLGIALGQLIAGPMSDSLGRRRPLIGGLVGYVAASLACAFAPSIWALIVLRLIQGILGGAGVVIARAIVRDLFAGAMAAKVFATLMAVMGVAPIFAPLIGGQVLAITSWRGIFVILGAIGVPLLLATILWLPETLPPHDRRRGGLPATIRTFGRLISDRSYAPYALSFALATAAMFAYIAGSSFVLEDVYGVSPQVFGLVFAVNSAGLISVSQIGGRVVARVGAPYLFRRGLIGTGIAASATLVFTVAHAGLVPLIAALFVLLTCNGIVLPNGAASAMAGQRGALGSASALLGLGQFGLGALIAPLVGIGGPHDALPMGLVIGICGLAALAVNLILSPRIASASAPA
jgi:DHA1 family bicyclomycin/chloramphenicol resistance-like MFS transporter